MKWVCVDYILSIFDNVSYVSQRKFICFNKLIYCFVLWSNMNLNEECTLYVKYINGGLILCHIIYRYTDKSVKSTQSFHKFC